MRPGPGKVSSEAGTCDKAQTRALPTAATMGGSGDPLRDRTLKVTPAHAFSWIPFR